MPHELNNLALGPDSTFDSGRRQYRYKDLYVSTEKVLPSGRRGLNFSRHIIMRMRVIQA